MDPVEDIEVDGDSVGKLVHGLGRSGGFTAKKFSKAVEILEGMFQENCTNFLSFPACLIATGTRGILKDMVRKGLFQAVVTTCGTLDHDLARIWKDYYHGHFQMDDRKLHKKGLNRLGNILIPNESYGIILEEKLQPMFEEIYQERKEIPPYELIWKIGEKLDGEKNKDSSIIYWCWKNQIPVFVPGIFDGAFGSQLWMFWQRHRDFKLNLFEDEQKLSDIAFDAKKTGALILGGGISKHHTIWWNQFKGGLDYAVYVTTAHEYDGSLSGARPREAVSWGKIKENAPFVTVDGDATLILPLIWAALHNILG